MECAILLTGVPILPLSLVSCSGVCSRADDQTSLDLRDLEQKQSLVCYFRSLVFGIHSHPIITLTYR